MSLPNSPLLTIVAGEESGIARPPRFRPVAGDRLKSLLRERYARRAQDVALGLMFPAFVFALWWWASDRLLLPNILPGPKVVFATFEELLSTGELETNLGISLLRVAKGGFALGGVLGLALGFARDCPQVLSAGSARHSRTLAQGAVTGMDSPAHADFRYR